MKRRQLIIINDNGMLLDNDDPPIKTVKLKDGTIIKLTIPTTERNLPDQRVCRSLTWMLEGEKFQWKMLMKVLVFIVDEDIGL